MSDEPTGVGALDALPTWTKVVAIVGFPIVAWLLLFAVLVGWIPSRFSQACDSAIMASAAIPRIADQMDSHMKESQNGDVTRLGLLRQICRNTSQTELGRELCGR